MKRPLYQALALAFGEPPGGAVGRAAWAGRGVLIASAALLIWVVLSNAWAGEDAFITFRTIDNFVSGFGLRWNLDERVQSYTHPLWLLANVPLYAAVRDVATTATAMGIAFTALAYGILGQRYQRRPLVLLLGLFLPLVLSRSVVLYSTSGFENSLSHLCVAAFAALFLRALERPQSIAWAGLAATASLAAVNRLDTALLYAPPLVLLAARQRGRLPWLRVFVGLSPLAIWLAFSSFYYGFPYPNTALSKVNEEIPAGVLLGQGGFYLLDLWARDPVGFAVLALGLALTLRHGARALAEGLEGRSLALASLGAGALLQGGWVLAIGGCFLSGRHWTLPIWVCAALLAEQLSRAADRMASWLAAGTLVHELHRVARGAAARAALAAAVVLALGLAAGRPLVEGFVREHAKSIIALPRGRFELSENFKWLPTRDARDWQRRGRALPAGRVSVRGTIGIMGYFAPRDAILVDFFGLADPLVARLPTTPGFRKIGHFRREIPKAYPEVRAGGPPERLDPALRAYYEPLRSIVSDPLLDPGRLAHLVRFHLGRYDERLEEYVARRATTGGSEPGAE